MDVINFVTMKTLTLCNHRFGGIPWFAYFFQLCPYLVLYNSILSFALYYLTLPPTYPPPRPIQNELFLVFLENFKLFSYPSPYPTPYQTPTPIFFLNLSFKKNSTLFPTTPSPIPIPIPSFTSSSPKSIFLLFKKFYKNFITTPPPPISSPSLPSPTHAHTHKIYIYFLIYFLKSKTFSLPNPYLYTQFPTLLSQL